MVFFKKVMKDIESFWEPLSDKPNEDPDGIARTLWHVASGNKISIEKAKEIPLPDLNSDQMSLLNDLIDKKRNGVPLSHLCERTMFLDMEFITGPEALIPRVETEILGKNVLTILQNQAKERGTLKVLDVCTGCGNLAVAYAKKIPEAHVFASDISEEAIQLARKNAEITGTTERLSFQKGDMFEAYSDESFLDYFDLISANPPYISTNKVTLMHKEISQYEPNLAFNGGAFGISILMRLLKEGPKLLRPGGWLCFEIGLGQGPALLKKIHSDARFSDTRILNDENGNIRALLLQRTESDV